MEIRAFKADIWYIIKRLHNATHLPCWPILILLKDLTKLYFANKRLWISVYGKLISWRNLRIILYVNYNKRNINGTWKQHLHVFSTAQSCCSLLKQSNFCEAWNSSLLMELELTISQLNALTAKLLESDITSPLVRDTGFGDINIIVCKG